MTINSIGVCCSKTVRHHQNFTVATKVMLEQNAQVCFICHRQDFNDRVNNCIQERCRISITRGVEGEVEKV